MSKFIKFGVLIVLAGLLFVIAFAGSRTENPNDEFRFDAANLKDKTTWTQVNSKPYYISSVVDGLCAMPTASDYQQIRKSNPHLSTFITVYVNNAGREAMFAKEQQRFPEGSIIVKEKIGTRFEDAKPVLYTIMRKRERGFNPSVGDWEFAVVDGKGTEVQAIGKLENCQSCHIEKSDSDFVFRPYVKSE
jgi:hypothetical protein